MKKRIAALILALLLIALPAFAQSVEDELAAYWEKANPLYDQIEALGARQTEIYLQFGLSLTDEEAEPMDDAAYEQYVRGLGVLTEDELKTLMETNAEIVKLADEADALSASYQASDDPTERSVLDGLIHYKNDQIQALAKSIAELDDKLRVAEETNYVMGLEGLDDAARQELLSMYATQRDIEKQLSSLEEALSEAAREELYGHDH
jgi:hypothetical protein